MENNLQYYNAMKTPPPDALRTIRGGRIAGMTDINPQWRYQAMTEQFGPCGIGWKYSIERLWLEPTAGDQVCAFASINVSIKVDGEWSEPIPGIGGSMLVTKETNGLHVSDECFKMAITDALSVALKVIGVAADIYAGLWDGSKFKDTKDKEEKKEPAGKKQKTETKSKATTAPPLKTVEELIERAAKFGISSRDVLMAVSVGTKEEIIDFDEAWKATAKKFKALIAALADKPAQGTPTPTSTPEPAPEPVTDETRDQIKGDVFPGMDWLKKNLPLIKWPEKTAVSWITGRFNVKGGLIKDVLPTLTAEQVAEFVKEIKDRLEMV